MPRFYFNVFNDVTVMDEEGSELADLAAAQRQARKGAAELIAEVILAGGKIDPSHRVEVLDADHKLVHTLTFGDLIQCGDEGMERVKGIEPSS